MFPKQLFSLSILASSLLPLASKGIIHGMEYYDKTAVMSVKANGAGLLDKEFFDLCGCNVPEIK